MKFYQIKQFGSIDGIVLSEKELPQPGPREVQVKIHSVSINRRDWYILHQVYPLPAHLGVIPLSDGAGEVIALGKEVTRFKIGDRVVGNYFPRWRDGKVGPDIYDQLGCTFDGMLAEQGLFQEDWLVHIPDHLSWDEASTLPCAALTAWSCLKNVTAGETVLTIGTGGVSLFAVQLAKILGAKVIALTSRDEKFTALKNLGADHTLNYHNDPQWHQQVLSLTNGSGVDRIIETGGPDTIDQSLQCTCIGGEVVMLSPMGTISPDRTPDVKAMLSAVFLRLVNFRSQFVGSRLDFEAMNKAIALHKLRPVIDKTYSFNQVHEAYREFSGGDLFGKVVIRISH